MKTRVKILSALLVLTLVIAARADTLNFLCDKAVDPASLLPAPAAVNSEEGKAELDFLVALQKQRTPEQVTRCRTEMNLNMALFQGVLGPWLTPANLPALDPFPRRSTKTSGTSSARPRRTSIAHGPQRPTAALARHPDRRLAGVS